MQDYSHTLLSKDFVNLTAEQVCLYEETTGCIVRFDPVACEIPPYRDRCTFGTISKCYIVEDSKLEEIKRSGRKLGDIALIQSKQKGRHNIDITYLASADDISAKVKLYKYDR